MAGPFETAKFQDTPGEEFWTWGSLLKTVRKLLTPVYERTVESAKQAAKEYDTQVHELACEMGSRMYHAAHQTGAAQRRDLPKNDLTKEEKAVLTGDRLAEMKEQVEIPRKVI
jgi:hypothetical protein